MKIGIIIPSNTMAGIQKLAAILANDLARNGYGVTIFIPRIPYFFYFVQLKKEFFQWIKLVRHYVIPYLKDRRFVYHSMISKEKRSCIMIRNVPRRPNRRQLDSLDYLIVMTIAQVAEIGSRFPQERMIYLVHHPEEHIYPFSERFHAIRRRFKGKILAISPWTAQTLSAHIPQPPVVPDVVSELFWDSRSKSRESRRTHDILYHFSSESNKGGAVGNRILNAVLEMRPHTRWSVWSRDEAPDLPSDRLHRNISEAALRDLYLEHKLLLFPSTYEGFGMPPIEAMACGCIPVLFPKVGAADLYASDGVNAIFIEDDIPRTAEKISTALDREDRLETMRSAAADSVAPFNPSGYGMRLLAAAGVGK